MRIFTVLIFSLIAAYAQAQCSVISFTLNTTGTDAEAIFEAAGAQIPLYVMDWGDGTIDTSSVPILTHSYATDGYYEAIYYYSDQANPFCSDFSYYPFIITGGSCSLSFTATTISNAVYVESSTQNVSVPLVSINWGDGSPDTSAYNALHAYDLPGSYLVCLTMTDGDPAFPCEVTECQNVDIAGEQGACTLQVDATTQGQTATLAINSSAPGQSYFIDWGDGSISQAPATSHNYPIANTYNICVYYGTPGDLNCQSTACVSVVIDPFASDCVFQIVPIVTGMTVDLQVQQAGAAQPEIYIDWGTGGAGQYGVPATFEYPADGTYTICATYTDLLNPIGCQLNDCVDVVIGQATNSCEVSLTVSQTGALVTAVATGTGATQPAYFIDWGDGALPTLSSEGSHEYANPGGYEVCVTYSDIQNTDCMATSCQTVNILAGVDEQDFIAQLQLMPNPVADRAVISFSVQQPSPVVIEVLDVSGRSVATIYNGNAGQGANRMSWDASELSSGMYFIQVNAQGQKRSVRFTK